MRIKIGPSFPKRLSILLTKSVIKDVGFALYLLIQTAIRKSIYSHFTLTSA